VEIHATNIPSSPQTTNDANFKTAVMRCQEVAWYFQGQYMVIVERQEQLLGAKK
jgi:hypothetical protein